MTTPEQIPMFEGPAFCPLMPPHGSLAERALFALAERDITTPEWNDEGNGWRLSASVKDLDYLGWEPNSILVNYVGCKRPIARYSLPVKAKQAIAAMRQGGDHA